VRREFDARCALTRDYAPYRTVGGPQGYRQISYDALGRRTAVALYTAGGVLHSSSGLAYAGLEVTATDALGHSTTRTMTAWGTLARVLDAAGGQMLYDHDAFGQPKRVTDPAGNVVSRRPEVPVQTNLDAVPFVQLVVELRRQSTGQLCEKVN
jgi:YD repeat-containing protein